MNMCPVGNTVCCSHPLSLQCTQCLGTADSGWETAQEKAGHDPLLPGSLQPIFLVLLPCEAEGRELLAFCCSWLWSLQPLSPSPRNMGTWHVVIRIIQLTEPGAKVHQIGQLLIHQQYNAVRQRNNITLLEWEQPVQCNPCLELACVPGSVVTPAMLLAGVPALRGVSSQRELVSWGNTWCTGRQVFLSQEQRPKSESGCGMYGSGEMDLALSPKPDRKDIAAPLQRPSQALEKEATLRQVRTDNLLLSAHSFLCSQLKGQVLSCKRPRSTSSMSSSEQQPVMCEGCPHPQLMCWLPGERHEHLPGRSRLQVTQPPAAQAVLSPPPNHLGMGKKILWFNRISDIQFSDWCGGWHVGLRAGESFSIYIFQLLHIPARARPCQCRHRTTTKFSKCVEPGCVWHGLTQCGLCCTCVSPCLAQEGWPLLAPLTWLAPNPLAAVAATRWAPPHPHTACRSCVLRWMLLGRSCWEKQYHWQLQREWEPVRAQGKIAFILSRCWRDARLSSLR